MDRHAMFQRILQAVDEKAYFTPAASVDAAQRPAMEAIAREIAAPGMEPDRVRARIQAAYADGAIDKVHMLSALHVVAAHPRVKDYAEAARLAGEQEQAALDLGGPHLEANLTSVDRHRGVLAFLGGHYGVALDHFTRALERQRTAENLGNVLAALLRLGELEEAQSIRTQVRRTLSPGVVAALDNAIASDPDLAALRSEEA